MMRLLLTLGFCALAAGSCARMEQRAAHYNPRICPFCLTATGVCNDCEGRGKCTFCRGTGTRTTTTASIAKENITSVTYDEKCPYCSGSGVCRYCQGNGKCRVCKGSGQVENWDFYEQYRKEVLAGATVIADTLQSP